MVIIFYLVTIIVLPPHGFQQNTPADILNLSFLRIDREWRIDKTNDVGTVSITEIIQIFPPITGDIQSEYCLSTVTVILPQVLWLIL